MIRNILFYISIFTFIFTSCAKEKIPAVQGTEKHILGNTITKNMDTDTLMGVTLRLDHVHWEPNVACIDFLKIFMYLLPDRIPNALLPLSTEDISTIIHCTIYENGEEFGYVNIHPKRFSDKAIRFTYGDGINFNDYHFSKQDPDPSAIYTMAITNVINTDTRTFYRYDPTIKVVIQNDGGSVH